MRCKLYFAVEIRCFLAHGFFILLFFSNLFTTYFIKKVEGDALRCLN